MKNATIGSMMAGTANFARAENMGSLFPNKVSYNPTNHIGGNRYRNGELLCLSARRDGNNRGISIIRKRKKLIRKIRAIIIRLRIYTEMRLKILCPRTVMRIPIKRAKINEMEIHEANKAARCVKTNRRLYTRVGDCHFTTYLQKTNLNIPVMPTAKRQIKRK
jgi:hypothetical protein